MRTHIRTLLAVILLAGCPSGDDDDTSNDDDVTANDDDIANDDDATGEEVWGEVFLGAPDDFTKPSTAPAGTQVSELGTNNVTETNLAVNTPECLTARNNLVFAVSEDLINCTPPQPFAVRGKVLN